MEMPGTEEIFFLNSNQTPNEFLNDIITLKTRSTKNGVDHSKN